MLPGEAQRALHVRLRKEVQEVLRMRWRLSLHAELQLSAPMILTPNSREGCRQMLMHDDIAPCIGSGSCARGLCTE